MSHIYLLRPSKLAYSKDLQGIEVTSLKAELMVQVAQPNEKSEHCMSLITSVILRKLTFVVQDFLQNT